MPTLDLFDPLFSVAARACENSAFATGLLRKFDFRGKRRIVQRIRRTKAGPEVLAICDGTRYRLDLKDDVQREVYFRTYDLTDFHCALEAIPPGGTCLDLGANVGEFALRFANWVGPTGRVFAFEADPGVFSRLALNRDLNGLGCQLECIQAAVSNVNRTVNFYGSGPEHSGWGSMVEFKDISRSVSAVQALTLDAFLAERGISKVDFLKIDVEAHEPEVLEGACESLRHHVFRFVLIEFNGFRLAQRGKSFEDFVAPLESAGYAATKLRLDEFNGIRSGQLSPEKVCTNFLFTPQNR